MAIVSIERCQDYEFTKVKEIVYKSLDRIESIRNTLKQGMFILVKPNLLRKNRPEDCVTTHPAVVEAVCSYLIDLGCKVIIGDSPAGPLNKKLLEGIYKSTGMEEVAKRLGCETFNDISYDDVTNENALMLKKMQVITVVQKVDYVVDVAKMKTHCMMTYSGAVKNLFGVIPGLIKADYHFKLIDERNFANHLVDICEYVAPLFCVVDAIDAMEGDGPSNGVKKHVGLILTSDSAYALDSVAVRIAGIEPSLVPTIEVAKERKLFDDNITNITFPLLKIEDTKLSQFKLPATVKVNFIEGKMPKFIEERLIRILRSKPAFNLEKCVSCGDCKRICPAQIIDLKTGKPVPDLNKCISCFCCHEVCPHDAVNIKKHWLHGIMYR